MKPGPLWERTLMLWFRERGWPEARRLFGQGANDCGDIDGVADWLIQAKNTGVMELGRVCAAAAVQARRAGKARWACVWKRRNHGVAQAYVVLELGTFTELIGGGLTCSSQDSRAAAATTTSAMSPGISR